MTTTTPEITTTGNDNSPIWPEITRQQELMSMISDDYKSLYGIRPRFLTANMSVEELEKFHNEIREDLEREFEAERRDREEHAKRTAEALTRKSWTLGELVSLGG